MQNVFLSIIMFMLVASPSKKEEKYKSIVVLELFTSQGCSSCPSADDLLYEVKHNNLEQVITLSYHVDYWNYIGWKDPFSKKEFSDKQRTYSSKFSSSSIYTPQVVVNGMEHFVGSDRDIMKTKLKSYLAKSSENKVAISNLNHVNKTINFNYNILGDTNNKKLRALLVIDNKTTSVNRGENKNRILKNSNIVVVEAYLNILNKTGKLSIPEIVDEGDKLTLVLLLENDKLDITGGSQIKIN